MKQLADVADIFTGYPFRGKVYPEESGDLAVIQIKDVDAAAGLRRENLIMLHDDSKYGKYLLREGDVLFQSRGSRHPVAAVLDRVHGIAALGLHVIRPKRNFLHPSYLVWYLNHPNTQAKLRDTARGSYIPFVAKSDLASFGLPVPPLEVQEQIGRIAQLARKEQLLRSRLNELIQEQTDAATWIAATRTK